MTTSESGTGIYMWQPLHGRVIAVSGQHRFPAKSYRPDPQAEFQPVHDAVHDMGFCMNTLIRAFLRWVAQDPEPPRRLEQFADLMREVYDETPRGRPRRPPA
jgi:hypothetical protein